MENFMPTHFSLSQGISYLRKYNIKNVIVNLSCRRDTNSLKVVAFMGIAHFSHNGETIMFPYTDITDGYFPDGKDLKPIVYSYDELYEVVPTLPMNDRTTKTNAKTRCDEFYNLLLELKKNNIAVTFMGHTAPEETLNWLESTLGKKVPDLNQFNPFDKQNVKTSNVNNSSCLLTLLILLLPIILYNLI
ncbi:MAG: hypothetical protein JEZ01_21035 [Labilibaculum sp.]|nr:hypothetical protein [Labilibaculum sp.]MBI9060265.1 hypothetical protein [Labilibaculum sp.]